jgi:hypothetical protein
MYGNTSRTTCRKKSHHKIGNKFFEILEHFRNLRTHLTNQNSIFEEITTIGFKPENGFYHSVNNLLSSSLLSKNIKIKTYRAVILLLFSMGVKLGVAH